MSLPRRKLLKRVLLGAAALGPAEVLRAVSAPIRKNANDRLGVAVVGCGGRGNIHISEWASSEKNTEVLYLCDADIQAGGGKLAAVAKKQGREPLYIQDFRRALEDPSVDIVSIASPNHWHSLHAILALQAGKSVYVEKPVSHNVWEGRQIVHWARKLNRLCQCGTQARSSPSLQEAHKWLHEGNLGKIRYAVGTCYKPRMSIGKLDKPLVIPENIDYDLWCGPAAKVDLYRPKLHYDWHWDWNTGNGDMGNAGIHQMDIARWFLNENELSPEILSVGGRLGYSDAGNTPNTQTVIHLYEKAPLIFETRGLPKDKASQQDGKWNIDVMDDHQGSRIGVLVVCENGWLLVRSSEATAFDPDGRQIQHWVGGGEHFANFADAVRSGRREALHADILEGHISSALCHTGGLSHVLGRPATAGEVAREVSRHEVFADSFERMAAHLRRNAVEIDQAPALMLGARLKMDPKTEKFVSHDQANQMLTRSYRAGYVVPDANG